MLNRHRRTILVLAVSVTTATMASVGVYRAVRRIPVRQVEVAHYFVVVAAHPIALGARIEHGDVKLIAWPSASRLPEAFQNIDDVAGRGVISPFSENEPITESKLAPAAAGAGLAPAIPAGMRAISIKVNDVIGVAGFAVPGARVDVVATVRHPEDAVARVLVSNVEVLAAGTRYDQQQARDGKPQPSTVVTLMVTPAQAERIALASNEGQLTLMLRNPLDLNDVATPGVRLAKLVEDGVDGIDSSAAHPDTSKTPETPLKRRATAGVARASAETHGAQSVRLAAADPALAPVGYVIEAIRGGKHSQEILK
jgi:pilus assembly protein CpaB